MRLPTKHESEIIHIFDETLTELASARKRYPAWPTDIVHATVVMVEEATEVLKAANEVRWQHKETTPAEVRKEVIQTMAMCLRLLTETPGL
jgi:hypothetical protein